MEIAKIGAPTAYTYDEKSSPIAGTITVKTIAMIAGAKHRHVLSLDESSAYLNAAMPKVDPLKAVHMRISPEIATLLVKLEPNMNQYTNEERVHNHLDVSIIIITKPFTDISRVQCFGIKKSGARCMQQEPNGPVRF